MKTDNTPTVLLSITKDSHSWSLQTNIDNKLELVINDDKCIIDLFEIVILGINDNNIIKDKEFWNIKINKIDKEYANCIHLIYYLTGGDKVWKYDSLNIWLIDWNNLSLLLMNKYKTKIDKLLKSSKTLNDIKNNILNGSINSELFYNYGLKENLIKKENFE